jgi:fumarate hydratase class II
MRAGRPVSNTIGRTFVPPSLHRLPTPRGSNFPPQTAMMVIAPSPSTTPRTDAIVQAAEEAISGRLDAQCLSTSGRPDRAQSNMNVNEVLGNRASRLLGAQLGTKAPVHPNDHVNMGQSSKDTFPTATHIATLLQIRSRTLPQIRALGDAIMTKAQQWVDVVKTGRTHLQDATPLAVGQEWWGWAVQIRQAADRLKTSLRGLCDLAAGGIAVGTCLNAPDGFAEEIAAQLAELTGEPLRTSLLPGDGAQLATTHFEDWHSEVPALVR